MAVHVRPHEPGAPQVMRHDSEHREDEHGVATLITRLGKETVHLLRQETALARKEVKENFAEAKRGAMALATSSVVMLSGLIVLLFAAAYAIAEFWPLWASFLVVGGGVVVIGAVMAAAGKKKLEPHNLEPTKTRETLREDQNLIREQVRA